MSEPKVLSLGELRKMSYQMLRLDNNWRSWYFLQISALAAGLTAPKRWVEGSKNSDLPQFGSIGTLWSKINHNISLNRKGKLVNTAFQTIPRLSNSVQICQNDQISNFLDHIFQNDHHTKLPNWWYTRMKNFFKDKLVFIWINWPINNEFTANNVSGVLKDPTRSD